MKDARKLVWEILPGAKGKTYSKVEEIIRRLLMNRKIDSKTRNEFFNPKHPGKFSFSELRIDAQQVKKLVKRISETKAQAEKIFIYGDYDADGIAATAILWETLYLLGFDVLPYIPERFSEGYGVKSDSIKKLKAQYNNLSLVICVDNGIVATGEIEKINKLGVDVAILDHHIKGKRLPNAVSIVHTDLICGAAISWVVANHILKTLCPEKQKYSQDLLDLAGIGTISDQMPLLGINRSFAKHGIESLRNTKRIGLIEIYRSSAIDPSQIGTYEVGFIIAPRINAMGRIEHGIDSLRILCTKDTKRAKELAKKLSDVNRRRQEIVDQVLKEGELSLPLGKDKKVIIISSENYHEGVIGLAAGKLTEEYCLPAIVISKGKEFSKGSARSISGFNIIEAIKKLDHIIEEAGGHPMAAGFTIRTSKLREFKKEMEKLTDDISKDILVKKLRIDLRLDLGVINKAFYERLENFEPFGLANPRPVFVAGNLEVYSRDLLGKDKKHTKLQLKSGNLKFVALGFSMGVAHPNLKAGDVIDAVFGVEENIWNGRSSLELRLKDFQKTS